jgi:hypothetical protein
MTKRKRSNVRCELDEIADNNEINMIVLDPECMDAAIVGVDHAAGRIVYDGNKIVAVLATGDMTEEQALDYYAYNIERGVAGMSTSNKPILVTPMLETYVPKATKTALNIAAAPTTRKCIVLNAKELYQDCAFVAWLVAGTGGGVATHHGGSTVNAYSNVFIPVTYPRAASRSTMPKNAWKAIASALKRAGAVAGEEIVVWLRNK